MASNDTAKGYVAPTLEVVIIDDMIRTQGDDRTGFGPIIGLNSEEAADLSLY